MQNKYKSKVPNMTDEQMAAMAGSRQDYFIKGGFYKSLVNGSTISMLLYDPKTNRLYSKKPGSDTLYWSDGKSNAEEILEFKIEKNRDTVMGHVCDVITIKTATAITYTSYSQKFELDRDKFKNHDFFNWSFYTSKAGAVPLRIVMEHPAFTMVSTATEIKAQKLPDNSFEIAVGTPIKSGE